MGARILVVEDFGDTAEMEIRLLEKAGYEPMIASSGRAALEAFANNEFDIILLDIGMPDMAGFEVAQEIRKTNKEIPILAITGYTNEDGVGALIKPQANRVGISDVMYKPFDPKVLLAKVDSLLGMSKGRGV